MVKMKTMMVMGTIQMVTCRHSLMLYNKNTRLIHDQISILRVSQRGGWLQHPVPDIDVFVGFYDSEMKLTRVTNLKSELKNWRCAT